MLSTFKKSTLALLLVIFVFVTAGSTLLFVKPARAIPVEILSDLPSLAERFIKTATINIAIQSFSYFLRRVAYDTAVWMASGGKGQTPFAQYKDFGSYMKDVGDNAAGVAIEALGSPYGLNLCKIPDPKVDLAMRIGLTYRFMDLSSDLNVKTTDEGVRKPTCTWSEFNTNVLSASNWQSQFGSSDDIARKFNLAFDVDQTDIGILLRATDKIDSYVAAQTEAARLQREEGDGYNPKTTLISGDIQIPAANIKEEAQSQNPSNQAEKAEAGFLATLSTGAVGSIAGAGTLFLNTLASQVLKNWQTKGVLPLVGCIPGGAGGNCSTLQDRLATLEGQVVRGGRTAAQNLFSDLLTPPSVVVSQYDTLVNFTNCPSNPGPDNCVADNGLAQAAQEIESGGSVTVAQALQKNWLHGEWKLISPERAADNTDPNCHQRAYCYANIAKLRKARILPLGFEIAALNSDPDKPWTLKQVVDGFNDCNFIKDSSGKVVGVDNDPVNKPFCRLIDPDWVIKSLPSKCNFMGFGSNPYVAGSPNRAKECADMTTCVAYDKDGNCATQGYCTREKNVWQIDAAKCDSQNRTCQSFQDSTGKTVSYLYRTLDTGFCNQDTVGCTQYSLKKNDAGSWLGYSPADLAAGENSAIYLNNKVSTNCSANSDGCSAFKTASTSQSLYLRKAPTYSKCYDSDPSTAAIDWPRTASDLNRLPTNATCNSYSQACTPEEVNCNWYDPVSYGGNAIPGKFTPAEIVEDEIVWNDQCDKSCVGYAAYREMPSNYFAGESVSYIIPSSGRACGAVDEGCTSFTNLSDTENGLEKVENFSYLRPCILPDATKQKNFFTYEGSAQGGFQLKSFVLEQDRDGSPKYFYRTSLVLEDYNAICNESLYNQGLASPDCRQFNDDQGVVYYRLLSKTIAVSNTCVPYRLNNPETITVASSVDKCTSEKGKWDEVSGTCQQCYQGGEYRDGQCFYYGLPGGANNTAGTSKTCAASENTCRAYKGNAGNNVRNIFSNNFEEAAVSGALAGWAPNSSISQSLESTRNGEHSLSYTGAVSGGGDLAKSITLTPGNSYDLTFWAKGAAGETVTVLLENDQLVTLGTVSVGDNWQSYHLGPVELSGTVSSTQLKFQIGGRLFIDNIVLKEVADYIYLVKNSLSVNALCDSTPNDNLPGEALGCSTYQTPNNQPIYLTGFTSLCREKAIGCTAVYDTFNTPDEAESRAYNVWLSGAAGQTVSKNIAGYSYTCQVAIGQTGCYINVTGATLAAITADGGVLVTSTVYVQADTPATTPIYLVANREATCSSVDLGCTKAGRLVQTPTGPTYTDVMIKKDPNTFNTTLCQSEAVGCGAYGSANGTSYFKDPAVVGQKVCAYRNNITKNGVAYSGWFWKGVGRCVLGGGSATNFCTADTDCAGGATCQGRDEQACYPSYLQSGNNYGLWSYGDTSAYNNFVGECPAAQSGCTEYIDRNENNKTYYLINDDRLAAQQTECNGQVSEKSGCILLDKTDNPNKLWSTARSYQASAAVNNGLVTPVAGSGTVVNDSNTVLKVSRDRECGEWLQCRSSHRVFDVQLGTYKEVCDDIGRCNQAITSGGSGDIINCANWVDNTHELSGQVLTENAYRNRSTDWKGQDFSGYSILNAFPAEELSEVNVGTSIAPDWRLVKTMACGSNATVCRTPSTTISCNPGQIGQACGRNGTGVCLGAASPVCVQNLDSATAETPRQSISPSCRAYPEETSPFPNSQAIDAAIGYDGVNVCNETTGPTTDNALAKGCECNYTKVTYGGVFTKYWNFNSPNSTGILNKNNQLVKSVVPGICSGGTNADRVCSTDADCAGSGSCQKVTKQSKLIGWQGYCIEPDLSRPLNAEQNNFACLTWFPKDNITGAYDINNQHVEAGFQASDASGKYFCLNADGNQTVTTVLGSDIIAYDKFLAQQIVSTVTSTNQGRNSREKRTVTFSVANPVYRDEIDYLAISATGNGDWFPNGTAKFFIRNGFITKYNTQMQVVQREGSEETPINNPQAFAGESGGLNVGRYVWSDGRAKNFWYMRYDDGEGDGNDQYQYADPTTVGMSGEQFGDLLSSCSGNIDVASGNDNYQDDCLGGDIDDNDDGCAIRAVFNTDGRLDRINLTCFSGDAGDVESASFTITAGMRETCASIAQTEDTPYTSVGWTDRLWSRSNFAVDPGGLNYKNNLATAPYGSLGMFAPLVSESLISIFSHFNASADITSPAIAGAPYSCTGNCLSTSPVVNQNQRGPASQTSVTVGRSKLEQIFAKAYALWTWTPSSTASSSYIQGGAYNSTEALTSATQAPKVMGLGLCKPGGKCLEGTTAGLSINDKTSGNIVFSSGVALVNAKFFGYADKNQMPIRRIKLDWNGNGTDVVSLDGYFRNQRGAVNGACGSAGTCLVASTTPGACNPATGANCLNTGKTCASNSDCTNLDNCFAESKAPNFGQILGQTCDSAYFRFDHVYQCTRGGDGWQAGALCPDEQTRNLYGGCCAFQPKVQLKDNWGWCNGGCGDVSSAGRTGCYDLECNFANGPYTSFAGQIILPPSEE